MNSSQSPYTDSVLIQYSDGNQTLERIPFVYTVDGTEKIHTVLSGETLQSMAHKYLGDSGLWYKISDANNLIDPFTEVVQGKQLIIPNL